MNLNTKLFIALKNIQQKIRKKVLFFDMYFATGVFFLFFGFLSGNVFGSFLNIFRESIRWDGFVTLFVILFAELISYLIYHSEKRILFFQFDFVDFTSIKTFKFLRNFYIYLQTWFSYFLIKLVKFINLINFLPNNVEIKLNQFFLFYKKSIFIKSINLFKIGILLGFFIDAFKVGS